MWLWWNRWIIEDIDHHVFSFLNSCLNESLWRNYREKIWCGKSNVSIHLQFWMIATIPRRIFSGVYSCIGFMQFTRFERSWTTTQKCLFDLFGRAKKTGSETWWTLSGWIVAVDLQAFLLGTRPSWRFPIDLGYFQVFQAFNHFCIDFFWWLGDPLFFQKLTWKWMFNEAMVPPNHMVTMVWIRFLLTPAILRCLRLWTNPFSKPWNRYFKPVTIPSSRLGLSHINQASCPRF